MGPISPRDRFAVELQLSTATNAGTLLRMALLRVGVILQERNEEIMQEFSRMFVFIYRMLGGLTGL